MYLYEREGLGQPPRTPNPPLQEMCPDLRDMHGRYLDWRDYVNRTKSPNDKISKKLLGLGEKQFIRQADYEAYVEACKRNAIDELITQLIKQIDIEERKKLIRLLPQIFPWFTKAKTPQTPTTLKMRGP